MIRSALVAVLIPLSWLLAPLTGQSISKDQFRTDFTKAVEIADDKAIDRVMKRGPGHALLYYEELYFEKDKGDATARTKCLAMAASWKRCFDNGDTMEKLDRWCSETTATSYGILQKCRTQSFRAWTHYNDVVSKQLEKAEYAQLFQQLMELARNAESIGHNIEIADLWALASVVATKMPDKSITDRRDNVFAMEQFVAARKGWNFTFDEHYIRTAEFLKSEKVKIEVDEKAGDKRKTEGYSADAKGVDSLVLPNAVEAKHALKFEPLAGWEELDYGTRTHPVPAFWWMASTEKVGSHRELGWFHAAKKWLHRTGATKFVIADSSDPKGGVEVDVSPKGKVSTFWLDADKKRPYAMVFWIGSEREMVNEAELNLSASDNVANVHYRSASSWKAQIGSDTVTLYDDSADGTPGAADPFVKEFHVPTFGVHDAEKGTFAPLLDSMRVGKGPRVPFSEFVKLSTGWVHLRKGPGDDVGVRPLNPEYVKSGKVKLVWSGPKPSAPVQLVVQGEGDYKTAMFDVAGGKEVELPAATYRVIWGRIMNGKGTRAQIATLLGGDSKPFTVEAGKTFELKMGGPFALNWNRRGDSSASIDALKIVLAESSGCVFGELHGINLACEVLAAKDVDGKGAKVVGKFVRFTDPECAVEAQKKHNNIGSQVVCFPMPDGYRNGELVLSVKLPADGMKLALSIKKHPLFGDVKPVWQ